MLAEHFNGDEILTSKDEIQQDANREMVLPWHMEDELEYSRNVNSDARKRCYQTQSTFDNDLRKVDRSIDLIYSYDYDYESLDSPVMV